jgi:hypothetical protein
MFSEDDVAWIKPLAYTIFATIGGIVGYLMRTIDGKKKPTFLRALVEGASAGFVGFIILLLCQATAMSEAWTGVVVGVSGWLGANVTIQIVEKVVRRKLGVDASPKPEASNADNAQ